LFSGRAKWQSNFHEGSGPADWGMMSIMMQGHLQTSWLDIKVQPTLSPDLLKHGWGSSPTEDGS
jgi:hypothetical protein